MKFIKYIVASLLIAVLVGCNAASESVAEKPIKPVKLIEIASTTVQDFRTFPATVHASKQAELSFRISGELVKLDLMEGQVIQKGTVLAQLDDRDLKNTLLNAEANYELAQLDFTRKQSLLAEKVISKAEFDIAKATLKSHKANLQASRDQLSYSQIVAPFAGVVAKVYAENYQMVAPSQPILMLQDKDLMEIKIQASENLLLKFNDRSILQRMNAKVHFAGDNQGEGFDILFKEYASVISKGSQSYEVTFLFLVPQSLNVLPGMSAQVNIEIAPLNNSQQILATLPLTAILTKDGDHQGQQSYVYRFDSKTQLLKLVPVELGKVTSDGIEVLSGIEIGDQVVAAGVTSLSDGMQVKPLVWSRGV